MKKVTLLLCLLASTVWAESQPSLVSGPSVTPERAKGISVYMNPESVVEQGNAEHIQRFIISGTDRKSIVAWDSKAEGLIELIKQQPTELQENGVWMVLTNPASYSDEDNSERERLESLTRGNGIPLFECRGSELPDGWKRMN